MAAGCELAAELAREQARQIGVAMQVAVAHAAAVEHQAVIEQRAVAVRRGLELAEEIREELCLVDVDLRFLRDELGVVAVVRHGVVLLGDADLAERHRAQLARHDHAADARDVRAEAEHLQVEHQLRVIIERRGHVHGPVRQLERVRALPLGVLNALLDVAD